MRGLLLLCFGALLLGGCTQKEDEKKIDAKEEEMNMNEQLVGKWAGDIEVPSAPLPVLVELQQEGGTLSVPAQGLKNYPFESVMYDGNQVSIRLNLQGSAITIDGELKGKQIEATFRQNGGEFPLLLKAFEEQPVSYDTFTVPVENGDLQVALQKPSEQPSPIVLILAGSGPTDKDGNTVGAGKNDSLKMLAEGLADKGIASVRYDKRGIGDNMGLLTKEEDVSIDLFVDDAVHVINALLAEKAYSSVHIIGHSEGSLIGMLVAQKVNVDSFISLAGAGRAADEVIIEQLEGQLSQELLKESINIFASLKKGEPVEKVSQELQMLFRASVQPYLMSWLKYNPSSELQNVNSRTMIIQGTTDIQVPKKDAEALKNGKNDAELLFVEGMNHVLKNAPADRKGNLATYTDATLPLHPELLPAIHKFIVNEQ